MIVMETFLTQLPHPEYHLKTLAILTPQFPFSVHRDNKIQRYKYLNSLKVSVPNGGLGLMNSTKRKPLRIEN